MIVFVIVFLALASPLRTESVMKKNSLAGPYTADGKNLDYWDLTGNARPADGSIRLTPDEPNKQGAIWNNFANLANNWELQAQFYVHGHSPFQNGDGMAIWYVREEDTLSHGPVFGSKDFFSGLGVFIDTFANQVGQDRQHPHSYISVMVNNGSLHYAHEEDGTFTQIGGCPVSVRNIQFASRIAISYISNAVSVYIDNQGMDQWSLCCSVKGVYLPTGYFFGVSASTRAYSDNHDLISITSFNLDPEEKEWEDHSDIIPEAKNVEIPKKYYKEFIEENLKKVEGTNEYEEEDEETEDESEETEDESEEPPSTSVLRKVIYITGAALIILVVISICRKFMEIRRERMHKRLF